MATKFAADKRDSQEQVTALFRRVFGRAATDAELADAVEYLQSETDQKKAWGNLLWALINTKEFQFIH